MLLSRCRDLNDLRLRGWRLNGSPAFFVANQLQVSRVDEHAGRLSQNEHHILPINGIGQQNQGTTDAEVPEHRRDHAAFFAFAAKPLHDESGCEQELTCQTECYPDLFVRHKPDPSFRLPEVCFDA